MPSYPWTCYACQSSSPASTEICAACGFPVAASSVQIAQTRRKIAAIQSPKQTIERSKEPAAIKPHSIKAVEDSSKSTQPHAAHALLIFAFGVVCLVGAYQSFASGHWPVFMPPQLDLFAVPFTWLSERIGSVVGGVLAGLVGVTSVVASVGIFSSPSATPCIFPKTTRESEI